MKVKFLGIKNQERKSGCSSCGNRRVSKYSFQREKRMMLPSGKRNTFIANQVYEVIDHDGIFLLDQTYNLNGTLSKMFEKVE